MFRSTDCLHYWHADWYRVSVGVSRHYLQFCRTSSQKNFFAECPDTPTFTLVLRVIGTVEFIHHKLHLSAAMGSPQQNATIPGCRSDTDLSRKIWHLLHTAPCLLLAPQWELASSACWRTPPVKGTQEFLGMRWDPWQMGNACEWGGNSLGMS